ncbi:hypothetical protein B0H34DRAFT_417317 [Crassisporium funariophilum]|nr:hypothetical protein B0H34DRAFT_417317 [Crassisporium funariophilum]
MTAFSSLSLFPANLEQILESRKRTFQQWGKGVTFEEYMERDARTDMHEVAQDGRLITWILAPRDAHDSLDFLCSCETYRRDGLAVRKSSSDQGDLPEVVPCYAVASVYTPPTNRGKGYARHMMRLLHWVLAPETSLPKEFPAEWGLPPPRVSSAGDAVFSVLYSDVGKDFYRVCSTLPAEENGWVVTNPISTTWEVVEIDKLSPTESKEFVRQWSWLDEGLVYEMWNKDAEMIKQELSLSSLPTPRFTFLPHKGVAEFQHRRLQFFWSKMDPRPTYWGVSSIDATKDASTFATWTLDVRPPTSNKLIITRLRASPEDFESLMTQVMTFAKRHFVEMIEVWNLRSDLKDIAHRLGGKSFARDEHLPSFKSYGGEKPEDITWMYNEKYMLHTCSQDSILT